MSAEDYVQRELAWDGAGYAGTLNDPTSHGTLPEETFYHPYMAPDRIENSVIDFDIENLKKLLEEKSPAYAAAAEKIANKVNAHYLDSARLIKRAFGNKIADDFQMFNWGLTLTMDMGLAVDKLELLLNVYAKKLPRRITRVDFDYIIEKHSTVRRIVDKHKRKLKWMDLVASFKIHTVRKPGFPDTIGKRQFCTIMDVNEIDLDLDVPRIIKDMRRADVYANRLHMLLLDDPLISGSFQEQVKSGKVVPGEAIAPGGKQPRSEGAAKERLRDFEARVKAEEEEFGPLVQQAVDEKMRQEFQAKETEEARRAAARKAREDARLEARRKEEAQKKEAIERLEQIRREREEWERKKAAEKVAAERAATERAAAEKAALEREAAEKIEREARAAADRAAQAERAERLHQAELEREAEAAAAAAAAEEAAVGMFDHLTGEERLRAETAYRLAEHRRIKAIERKRLLEETRQYAESQLARRAGGAAAAEAAAAGAGGGADHRIHVPALPNAASAAPATAAPKAAKKRKNIEAARAARASTPETLVVEQEHQQQDLPSTTSNSAGRSSPSKPNRRSRSPTSRSGAASSPSMEVLVAAELREMDEEERARREAERAAKRAEEERVRIEAVRVKLRRDEDERIRQIEVQDSQRREAQLETLRRKAAEEASMQEKLALQAKARSDREARLAEAEALRQLAEEHREATARAEVERARRAMLAKAGGSSSTGPSPAQLAAEEAAKKARKEREAKQRATRERAKRLQEETEAKRAALASVIEQRHAAAQGARQKRGAVAPKDRPRLDADELWASNAPPLPSSASGLDGADDSYLYDGDDDGRRHSLGSISALTGVSDVGGDGFDLAEAEALAEAERAAAATAAAEALAATAAAAEAAAAEEAAAAAEAEARAIADAAALAEAERAAQEEAAAAVAAAAEAEAADVAERQRRANLAAAEEARLRASIEARDRAIAEKRQAEAEEREEEERLAAEAAAKAAAMAEAEAAARAASEAAAAQSAAEAERIRIEEEELAARFLEQSEAAALELRERLARELLEQERELAVMASEEERRRIEEKEEARAAIELEEQQAADRRSAELVRALEEEERRATEAQNAASAALAAEKAAAEEKRRRLREAEEEKERAEHERARLAREAEAAEVAAAEAAAAAEEERLRLEVEAAAAAELAAIEAERVAELERIAAAERAAAEARQVVIDEAAASVLGELIDAASAEASADIAPVLHAEAAALSVTSDTQLFPSGFERSSKLPPLAAIQRDLPSEMLTIDVPKSSDGTLRLNVRLDADSATGARGLFVHGFKTGSAAEQQGQLRSGDELLAVGAAGAAIRALAPLSGPSATLEALVSALKGLRGPAVRVAVRRLLPMSEIEAKIALLPAFAIEQLPPEVRDIAPAVVHAPPVIATDAAGAAAIAAAAAAAAAATAAAATVAPQPQPPLLDEVASFPAVDLDLLVPLSDDGRLRLFIRHDDEGDAHGLFIHGFKPGSAAERQGLLRTGDELLAVAGRDVKGRYLEDVVAALQEAVPPLAPGGSVAMTVRRHLVDEQDTMAQELAALEVEAKRVALEAMLDEIERQQEALGEAAGGADRREQAKRKKDQMERLVLEQKRQRELRMFKEAEERAKKAASMPNSLMNPESAAAFAKRFAPFEDLDLDVPKTSGELRVHVKHSKRRGLFVHGFKPGSAAEQQGLLRPGDELIAVEGKDVRGGTGLSGLVAALKGHAGESVNLRVRRHQYRGGEL